MTLAPGIKLGRYEIRSKIGEGGMGQVFQALDTELDRIVAIKVLPEPLASDQQRLLRFIQEAKAASALNHPHILTIHEIGTIGNTRFITTEFIDGETLRHRIRQGRLKLHEVLEICIQVAGALTAAHAAGIIHRDIKPENIMVRRDGYVKVLDFGLAKLTEPKDSTTDTEAPTKALVNTGAGTVIGTANYMSPEQAKGNRIDARSDLWSLGAVIYEMVTGHAPFEADTSSEVIGLILNREPVPVARYDREAPPELERIIEKALTKNRDERYQTAKDLSVDLKRLRRHIDLEAEIERTVPPEARTSAPDAAGRSHTHASVTSAQHVAAGTGSAEAIHKVSSAEYIVSEIKRHKKGLALGAAVTFALVLATVGYFLYSRRAPALTDKDTILIADFVNTTGDPVFDGTLKQALAVQLVQSPFLNIFSDDRVREALRFMERSPDDRVTRDVGRELCQRQGIKALLVGTISGLGSHFVITLEAINAQTGDIFAREQAEAESKEQVLKNLGEAATRLREKLGESLASIQKYDAPIEQATTSNLDALKTFSLGREQHYKGDYRGAIPFYKKAIELDPNFALAYVRLADVYSNTRQLQNADEARLKAYDLRDRVSQRERHDIESSYYALSKNVEKQIEVNELWKRTFARDYVPHNHLSNLYNAIGEYEKAVEPAREAVRLNPSAATARSNLARALAGLNRFDEAKQTIREALEANLESPGMHSTLFNIALAENDAVAMEQQMEWATRESAAHAAQDAMASRASLAGQFRKSIELSNEASHLALRRDLKEVAGQYLADNAQKEAFLNNCGRVVEFTNKALEVSRHISILHAVVDALSTCGDTNHTEPLLTEISRLYPKDSVALAVLLPLYRAQLELFRGNAARTIELLESTRAFEGAAFYRVSYVRGQAFLKLKKGSEAAVEFQKMIDHRGKSPRSYLYPLAFLGLGRAAVLTADTAKARKAYQDFFAMWRDADADIPILIEAKKEYEKLK